jgi:hypothetical protein
MVFSLVPHNEFNIHSRVRIADAGFVRQLELIASLITKKKHMSLFQK